MKFVLQTNHHHTTTIPPPYHHHTNMLTLSQKLLIIVYNLIITVGANRIYGNDNYSRQYSPTESTSTVITEWIGDANVSGDVLSTQSPYLTKIETTSDAYFISGFVNNGENYIMLYAGSVYINGANLTIPGETAWSTTTAHIKLNISTYSTIYISGAKFNLTATNIYSSNYDLPNTHKVFLNDTVDAIDPDGVINNGTADALNYKWGASLTTPPLVIVELKTPTGYIAKHQHPKGVVYLPLENCKICYCYNDDDDDCICTSDGDMRHEYAGIIYREIIYALNNDTCRFLVLEFYPFQTDGMPHFYDTYDSLNTNFIVNPLRFQNSINT